MILGVLKSEFFMGALIALIASLIAAIVQIFLTIFQQKKSAQANERARAFELKKQIIIDSVDGLARSREIIGQLPSTPQDDVNKLISSANLGPSLLKLSLVADLSTIKAVDNYMATYTENLFNLLVEKTKFEMINQEITSIGKNIEFLTQKQNEVMTKLEKARESQSIPVLKEFHEAHRQITKEILDEYKVQMPLFDKKTKEMGVLFEKSIDILDKTGESFFEAKIKVREEFEFKIDKEAYRELVKENSIRMKSATSKFLIDIKKVFENS